MHGKSLGLDWKVVTQVRKFDAKGVESLEGIEIAILRGFSWVVSGIFGSLEFCRRKIEDETVKREKYRGPKIDDRLK